MITVSSDTLIVDNAALDVWRNNPDFDYGSELVQSDNTLWLWLNDQLGIIIESVFGSRIYQDNGHLLFLLIGVAIVIAVVVYLIFWHPSLFHREEKSENIDYEVEEDTIYGIDFDSAVAMSLQSGDYRECVRLLYLQMLKILSDTGKIDWKLSKTPGQYEREFPQQDFILLSQIFLRIRYGNFVSDKNVVNEMIRLRESVCKVIAYDGKG